MNRSNPSALIATQSSGGSQPPPKKRLLREVKEEPVKSLDDEIKEAIKEGLFAPSNLAELESIKKSIEEERKREQEINAAKAKSVKDYDAAEKREGLIRRCDEFINGDIQSTKKDNVDLKMKTEYLMERVRDTTEKKEPPSDNKVVTLNVGGEIITTTTKTLKTPFFDILLSKLEGIPRDEKGNIYIDRSPAVFKMFLDCLRAGGISPEIRKELTPKVHDALFAEASYFGAYKLVEELRGISTPMGIAPYMATELCEKCKCSTFQLVYKASRDGFSAKSFHDRCNSLFPTLVLVRSTNGSIFGGYFETPWTSPEESSHVKGTGNEFMFSLVSPKCDGPVFFESVIIPYVHQSKSHGPAFGMNDKVDDFFISDKPNENSLSHVKGFSVNEIFNSNGYSNVVFNGSEAFSVLDYEVYFLPKWSNMSSRAK